MSPFSQGLPARGLASTGGWGSQLPHWPPGLPWSEGLLPGVPWGRLREGAGEGPVGCQVTQEPGACSEPPAGRHSTCGRKRPGRGWRRGQDLANAFSGDRAGDRHAHPGPGSQRPPLPRPQIPGPLWPHPQTLRPQAAGAQLESLHGEACRGRRGAGLSLWPEPTGPDRRPRLLCQGLPDPHPPGGQAPPHTPPTEGLGNLALHPGPLSHQPGTSCDGLMLPPL